MTNAYTEAIATALEELIWGEHDDERKAVANATTAINQAVKEHVIGKREPHDDADRITQNAQRQRNLLRTEQTRVVDGITIEGKEEA